MLARLGAHLGPAWGHVGPTWTRFGAHVGLPWPISAHLEPQDRKNKKPRKCCKTQYFLGWGQGRDPSLVVCKPYLGPVFTYVRPGCPILAHVGPILAYVGATLALSWPMLTRRWPYVGPCWPLLAFGWWDRGRAEVDQRGRHRGRSAAGGVLACNLRLLTEGHGLRPAGRARI